jgi:DNA-binding SARP family transcriptional activator
VELRVLGPVGAVVGGRLVDLGPPKQRALCALLVSRVGRPVAVDTLLEELWSECWELLAAARLSETELVTQLREQLRPYRRLACAEFAVAVSGSVAYFAIAVEVDEAMGALPWLVQARDAITRARRGG